jgi:electron transfer flavoprotein beta subunit
MNILVCVSSVPDTTTKITFKNDNQEFNSDGVQYIINPYDELALTKSLMLTEAHGGEVTIITVGEASVEPIMRKALAIGAHKAVRVNASAKDAMHVALAVKEYMDNSGNTYDVVFTGRESIDYNGGQVGPLLSELLDAALINVVTEVEVEENQVTAVRDIDGGREKVRAGFPVVLSAQKDLCEPRIPNMRGIMQARTKPLEVVESSLEYGDVEYASYELPKPKEGVKLIDANNPEELLDLLRNEKKLI